MRLSSINTNSIPPIHSFKADNLSDVVVIAGQNGVGKSRLVSSILSHFQNLSPNKDMNFVLEATSDDERKSWGKTILDTTNQEDIKKLAATLKANKSRTKWNSSIIYFESDRVVTKIDPYPFNWDSPDPWDEMVGWNTTFTGGLKARLKDTIHSLFRKIQNHDKKIARIAKEKQAAGHASMELNFSDPLSLFKEAFSQLLAPKKLLDLDPRDQKLYFEHEGQRLPVSSLSSGEREVVNIVFDFILRAPSDCIIFFDEPELHLHPELSYRLLQTLKSFGFRNQFIFCTHSADIITASLENTVIFITPPGVLPDGTEKNQAIIATEDDETNTALRLLGQSIGIISLGKKIVLIEGENSSLDKQTYGYILKNRFPDLVLVPSGGRDGIESFQRLNDKILTKTIWGVDFFMLCDPDTDVLGNSTSKTSVSNKLRYLKRYHLENYFLDACTLSKVFEDLEPEESWLRDEVKIQEKLTQLAKETIPYATALIVAAKIRHSIGNISVMPKELQQQNINSLVTLFQERAAEEHTRATAALKPQYIEELVRQTYESLENTLADGSKRWIEVIPGKQILARFASLAKLDLGRLKSAYVKAAQKYSLPIFDEIIDIFSDFSNYHHT